MSRKTIIALLMILLTVFCFVSCDDEESSASEVTSYTMPLTLKAVEEGTITFTNRPDSLQYSKNGENRKSAEDSIAMAAGDVIYLYAQITGYDSPNYTFSISCSSKCAVYGNVMSLIDPENYVLSTDLTGKNYAFYKLFYGATELCNDDTYKLVLPATSLSEYCYMNMFYGCTSLTQAPSLPATEMALYCYKFMFEGCTALTAAPELPAENLARGCYAGMFKNCTSLLTVSELPAATLALECYSRMFYGCTLITTAPELSAPTLVDYCYNEMFYGCTKLDYVTCYATDTSADNCTSSWLSGVADSGTFNMAYKAVWDEGVSAVPSGWSRVDDYYKIGDTGPAGGVIFYDCDADNDNGNADGLSSLTCSWRYLEAAPADLVLIDGIPSVDTGDSGYSTGTKYFCFGSYRNSKDGVDLFVNGTTTYDSDDCTGTAIGDGYSNTNLLVSAMGTSAYYVKAGETTTTEYYAAKLCSDLEHGGFDDWFLPSKDELAQIYAQRVSIDGIDYGTSMYYWSSSEYSEALAAWIQYFANDTDNQLYMIDAYDTLLFSRMLVRPIRQF